MRLDGMGWDEMGWDGMGFTVGIVSPMMINYIG